MNQKIFFRSSIPAKDEILYKKRFTKYRIISILEKLSNFISINLLF
jgi:hypothetical protein